jgi:uncharacterized membrane protein YadS
MRRALFALAVGLAGATLGVVLGADSFFQFGALWLGVAILAVAGAFLLARRHARRSAASVKKPWFILGFVAAAALATFVPELTEPGRAVAGVARYGMVLTLFLIGANLTPKALKEVGPRPLLQGFALWVLVSCGTLAGVVEGWIR